MQESKKEMKYSGKEDMGDIGEAAKQVDNARGKQGRQAKRSVKIEGK
jgi:hypothetical protein